MAVFAVFAAFLLSLPLLSCHKDNPVAPEVQIQSPLTLFPLLEGVNWEYGYYYAVSKGESVRRGIIMSTERIFGKLKVSVQGNLSDRDRERYQREWNTPGVTHEYVVELEYTNDSLMYESSQLRILDTTYTILLGQVETRSFRLRLERDTLWRVVDDSLIYMMPREFEPGGEIDLSIFTPPGSSGLLQVRLGNGLLTGFGDYLYQWVEGDKSAVARVLSGLGIRGILVDRLTGERIYGGTWEEKELIFNLYSTNLPGAVVPTPGKYW